MCTHNLCLKNMKTIQKSSKNCHFTAAKNFSILQGRVFVMVTNIYIYISCKHVQKSLPHTRLENCVYRGIHFFASN